MQVSKEIISEWKQLKEQGDTKELANQLGIASQNVSTILRTGKASPTRIARIQKYFDDRKAKLEQIRKGEA